MTLHSPFSLLLPTPLCPPPPQWPCPPGLLLKGKPKTSSRCRVQTEKAPLCDCISPGGNKDKGSGFSTRQSTSGRSMDHPMGPHRCLQFLPQREWPTWQWGLETSRDSLLFLTNLAFKSLDLSRGARTHDTVPHVPLRLCGGWAGQTGHGEGFDLDGAGLGHTPVSMGGECWGWVARLRVPCPRLRHIKG